MSVLKQLRKYMSQPRELLTQPAITCSKLTIKTPERREWRRSRIFIVNFEHISHLVLVFLLLTLNM